MPERGKLDIIASEVVACVKCDLWKSRRNAVPGVGDPKSRIVFIGEAPGQSEDIKGEPFVGAAGKFLDTLLSSIDLSRNQVFITNVVKCRPPENRDPKPVEIQMCTPYLDSQVKAIKPKFIVTLGKHSTAHVFERTNMHFYGIAHVRGKFYETTILGMQVKLFPTFHPAAALYNASYKETLQNDFQLLKNEIEKARKK